MTMGSLKPTPRLPDHRSAKRESKAQAEPQAVDEQDLLQIRDRLEWTPEQRLSYLRDMIVFEQLARTARRV